MEQFLKKHFRYRDILKDGALYLRRFYLIRTKPFAIFLHKIVRGDADRLVHNHPWPFGVLILRGSYWEELPINPEASTSLELITKFVKRGPGSIRFMRANQLHRVHLDSGQVVWSLFFRLRAEREWGFLTDEGWVPWQEYLKEKES